MDTDKYTFYYMNGKIHRDDALPAIIYDDGTLMDDCIEITINLLILILMGHKNGILMDDCIEITTNLLILILMGGQYWYINGQIHRDDDKPAIIYSTRIKCILGD